MTYAINAKQKVGMIMERMSEDNQIANERITDVNQVVGRITHNVGMAVTGLQFEDIVRQLLEQTETIAQEMARLDQDYKTTSESMRSIAPNDLSGYERCISELKTEFDERLSNLRRLEHRVVEQDSMDTGDVELF